MSPTIFREGPYRFFFFSREERRAHVPVGHPNGEAKIWLDPRIELAASFGLSPQRLAKALLIVRERENEIRTAWETHFPG